MASFDRVLGPGAGQEELFAAVGAQMVHNCMAGEQHGSCWVRRSLREPGLLDGGRGTHAARHETLRMTGMDRQAGVCCGMMPSCQQCSSHLPPPLPSRVQARCCPISQAPASPPPLQASTRRFSCMARQARGRPTPSQATCPAARMALSLSRCSKRRATLLARVPFKGGYHSGRSGSLMPSGTGFCPAAGTCLLQLAAATPVCSPPPACSAASRCASSASCLTASPRRSGTACATPSSAGAQCTRLPCRAAWCACPWRPSSPSSLRAPASRPALDLFALLTPSTAAPMLPLCQLRRDLQRGDYRLA